jgi:hypothetical protein
MLGAPQLLTTSRQKELRVIGRSRDGVKGSRADFVVHVEGSEAAGQISSFTSNGEEQPGAISSFTSNGQGQPSAIRRSRRTVPSNHRPFLVRIEPLEAHGSPRSFILNRVAEGHLLFSCPCTSRDLRHEFWALEGADRATRLCWRARFSCYER